ncbi:PREDICTED: uncharacterized protein LOC105556659 [Vollenhovia emeryi]|uniref:uncharacterized protein LOC105556659 n=1 Tax=Vollenhovia emeryi TaxID=411798 RepID=UPI0005F57E71|nr:PREDICTED: uncharacterized protein LOC105556659 [Vollenhovia emeryi]
MVRHRQKKTNRVHDGEKMKKAIKAVIINEMSLRKAGEIYEINFETLRRYVKKTSPVEGENIQAEQLILNADLSQHYNSRQIFSEEEEQLLFEYFLTCAELGHGLFSEKARQIAYEFAVRNDKKIPESWRTHQKAGLDWLYAFKKRHPVISLRKPEPCSLSRSSAFNKHNVSKYFENLEIVIKRNPNFANGLRVYNLDETGTCTVQSGRNKILARKGQRRVSVKTSAERGTLVTTCIIVNALGNVFPPIMIFPRKKFVNHMICGGYPGTLGLAFPSGWNKTISYLF